MTVQYFLLKILIFSNNDSEYICFNLIKIDAPP